MSESTDPEVLTTSVIGVAKGYLGGAEALRAIGVEFFGNEQRAIVWADLRRRGFDAELAAFESFLDVQDAFDGELELELRFGDMLEGSRRAALHKTLVLSN